MNTSNSPDLAISIFFALAMAASSAGAATEQATPEPQVFLSSLVGTWEGTCRTWFRPGELADESRVAGEFKLLLGGRFLRHTYAGKLRGSPRNGEETIAFNSVKNKFQTTWVDNFRMNPQE